MAISGWCGQLGKPAHQWCKSLVCSCDCRLLSGARNTPRNRANRRGVETLADVSVWDNGGSTESSPRLQNPSASTPGGDRGPNRTAKEFG